MIYRTVCFSVFQVSTPNFFCALRKGKVRLPLELHLGGAVWVELVVATQICLEFSPRKPGVSWSNLTFAYFSKGLVKNHQLVMIWLGGHVFTEHQWWRNRLGGVHLNDHPVNIAGLVQYTSDVLVNLYVLCLSYFWVDIFASKVLKYVGNDSFSVL